MVEGWWGVNVGRADGGTACAHVSMRDLLLARFEGNTRRRTGGYVHGYTQKVDAKCMMQGGERRVEGGGCRAEGAGCKVHAYPEMSM